MLLHGRRSFEASLALLEGLVLVTVVASSPPCNGGGDGGGCGG